MTATATTAPATRTTARGQTTGASRTAAVGAHADGARSSGDALVRRWLRRGKFWLLPMLLSDCGRDIIYRKYDAFTTDRAYENRPSGRLGPIGALVDWIVLQQDIHVGLRQRLAIVVDELRTVVAEQAAGGRPVRLVSGPCGLVRDLCLAWQELDPIQQRVEIIGLDLDPAGDVLPAARLRAARAGLPMVIERCDLLDGVAVARALGRRPADVFHCIGLAVWLDEPDLRRLLAHLHAALRPGGVLIVDNFNVHGASRLAADLEMRTRYHAQDRFRRLLADAGFVVEGARETRNRVDVVYRCRRSS